MFKKDTFLFGAIIGFIAPVLVFICVEILKFDIQISGKKHILYIACAIANLILVRICFKQNRAKAAEGIMFSLFICGLLFYIFKVR